MHHSAGNDRFAFHIFLLTPDTYTTVYFELNYICLQLNMYCILQLDNSITERLRGRVVKVLDYSGVQIQDTVLPAVNWYLIIVGAKGEDCAPPFVCYCPRHDYGSNAKLPLRPPPP